MMKLIPTLRAPLVFLTLLIGLISADDVAAVQRFWSGAISNDWNTAGNWSPAGVPASDDFVTIGGSGSGNPVLSSASTIIALNIGGGKSLTITPTGTLNVHGGGSNPITFDIDDATVVNNGSLIIEAPVGQPDLEEGLDMRWGSGTFINNGYLRVEATIRIVYMTNGPSIQNQSCGVMDLKGPEFSGFVINNGEVLNQGLVQIETRLVVDAGNTFDNQGVLKYGELFGTITNGQNSSVVVNDDPTPIFTYGGTYDGTINGIFTNEGATNSAGTFTPPNTFTPSGLSAGSQTLYASITPSGGGCTYVVPFTYVMNFPPAFTTNPSSQAVCSGSSASFTVAASNTDTYQWQVNTGGGFSNLSNGGVYANVTGTTLNISDVSGLNGYLYRCVATGAGGSANSNSTTLTVRAQPTPASAGPDQTGAATCGLTQVTLAANTPSEGTGAWSIISGAGGALGDASNPSSTFSGTAGSTYTLRWTISNSPCPVSTDEVTITFNTIGNGNICCPSGNVIFVDINAQGLNDGTSWTDAYTDLQDALSAAEACDNITEIWTAAGTYYPDEGTAVTDNDRNASFVLQNGLALYGGFAGTESQRSERDWETNVTILSGDIGQDDSQAVITDPSAQINGDNAHTVVTGSNTDGTAVIDGFTVTAGQAFGGSTLLASNGGGFFMESGSPTLANLSITGNSVAASGGGMYNFESSSPVLTNVDIMDNRAMVGGGMCNRESSSPSLTNMEITGNNATVGGGVYNTEFSSPTLTNVAITGNSATDGGGMSNFNSSAPSLMNVVITGNSVSSKGGGMFNNTSSSPSLTNVAITGNSAADGGGMSNFNSSAPTLTNTIIWDNSENGNTTAAGASIVNNSGSTPQITNCLIANSGGSGSWDTDTGTDGGNNIDMDPLFVTGIDPANAPTTAGDFRLQPCSPAIDAGDNSALPGGVTTDLDGNPRIYDNGTVDMGAYEYQGAPVTAPTGSLAITNSTCTDCSLSGGSIAIGSVTGTGGTLEYSTDNGAAWSSDLPAYDQDGPAQTILASVLSASGCRSSSVQVGVTEPGECEGPAAPTGSLAITNSTCTDCSLGGGSIAIGSVTGTGGTLEYSTDNGATWSSDLPAYDQDGPAQTILASVLSPGGCRSSSVQVGVTEPGECEGPAAPTGSLAITNSTCTDCSLGGGSIAIGSVTGTGGTLEYSTDNGATWSSDLPAYDQDGPAQTILASVLSPGGCRSNSTQVGVTVPGECDGVVANCQNQTVELDADGNGTLLASALDDNSTGCGTLTFAFDDGSSTQNFDCLQEGQMIAFRLNVTDEGGQSSTCISTVTISDTEAPQIICPMDILVDATSSAGAVVDYTAPAGTDNCTPSTLLTAGNDSGNIFPIGTTVITFEATDGAGNSNSCSFSIIVGNVAPDINCPENITVSNDSGGCSAVVTFEATETTGIPASEITYSQSPGTAFTVEETTVTATATNTQGSDECTFTVTVNDAEAPIMVCNRSIIDIDLDQMLLASQVDSMSTDNCAITQLSVAPNVFGCGNIGQNTVTLTAQDEAGNSNTCTATVNVIDNSQPTAVCADPTVSLTSDATTTVAASFFDGGSSAVCGGLDFFASMTEFDCDDVGETYTVTLTVTSQSSGLSDQCTSTVSVADPNSFCCAPPMAACEDITVQLDASGNASITPADIGSGSTAECGLASESLDIMDFGCTDVGENTVTYTITDVNGDSDNCTANVTVEDNLPPSAVCLSTPVELQPDGMYDLQQSDVYDSINSADNCSIATFNFSATTFDCEDKGQAFPITVTVTDPSGNTDNCTANVTVEQGGALPPEWTANDIGDPGNGSDYAYDPCAGNNPNQGDFTISTGGYNLFPQNADNLAFASLPLCGNGGIQARIESEAGGYAGLMIRESSAPGAKMVAVYSNLTNLLRRETRTVTNGTRSSSTLSAAFPEWLRLVRQGDYIRAFYRSSNGGSWTLFHQAYVPMGNCVEMGLAVFTTDPNGDATAVFGKVNYQSQGGQSLSAPNGIVWEAEPSEVLKASVVPNPVRGNFTLQFSKPLPAAGQATLLNEFGQRLSQQPLRAGERELGWDAGALPAGLYFLEVLMEDGYREVLKVVRQ